jgi:hypothetical protein
VLVRAAARVRVEVAVGFAVLVGVLVGVEGAPAPADQEPDGEEHDDGADRRLGGLPNPLRQVSAQQHERKADQEERGRVPEPPGEAHEGGLPDPLPFLPGRYEGAYGGKMVRVAGMPQAQEQADQQNDRRRVRTVQEPFQPGIYRCHAQNLLRGPRPGRVSMGGGSVS